MCLNFQKMEQHRWDEVVFRSKSMPFVTTDKSTALGYDAGFLDNAGFWKTSATSDGSDLSFPCTEVLVQFPVILKLDTRELPLVGLPVCTRVRMQISDLLSSAMILHCCILFTGLSPRDTPSTHPNLGFFETWRRFLCTLFLSSGLLNIQLNLHPFSRKAALSRFTISIVKSAREIELDCFCDKHSTKNPSTQQLSTQKFPTGTVL